MITVGLVRELYFISKTLQRVIYHSLFKEGDTKILKLCINPSGKMVVEYEGKTIWVETIEGESSFFGVESCDTISRIIACIDNGTSWCHLRWKESLA